MASVWINEASPAGFDDLPTYGTPRDVIARTRSAPPDEQDKRARAEDQEREQRRADARERQKDLADAMRLRGIEPPTAGESIAMRAAATFSEQDRLGRIRDRQMAELGENVAEERRAREQAQRELTKERQRSTQALRSANDAHRSRADLAERLRQTSYAPYRRY
jgi:hypothetical protein